MWMNLVETPVVLMGSLSFGNMVALYDEMRTLWSFIGEHQDAVRGHS
jgi:hypothetical protein